MSTENPVRYDKKRNFRTLYYTMSNFTILIFPFPIVIPLYFYLENRLQKL